MPVRTSTCLLIVRTFAADNTLRIAASVTSTIIGDDRFSETSRPGHSDDGSDARHCRGDLELDQLLARAGVLLELGPDGVVGQAEVRRSHLAEVVGVAALVRVCALGLSAIGGQDLVTGRSGLMFNTLNGSGLTPPRSRTPMSVQGLR